METNKLEKLKKQQLILLIAVPVTGFIGITKYFGLFSVGSFPPIFEIGLSILCLIVLIVTSVQIRNLEKAKGEHEN